MVCTTFAFAFGAVRATMSWPWAVATVELTGTGTAVWVGGGRSLGLGVGDSVGVATATGLATWCLGEERVSSPQPSNAAAAPNSTATPARACFRGGAFASRDSTFLKGVLQGRA